jgi:hypothetical protein
VPPRRRPSAPKPLTLGGAVAGRYELRELLGDGAMGSVYRAFDRDLEREVAVKAMLPALAGDPEFVGRFQREARALARLRHPNIIGVHDLVKVPEGGLFLILELVRGRSLHEVIAAEAPLPWSRCADIGIQVGAALAAAHAAGVVHRDIKPGNILIEETGAARVADFGVARLAEGGGGTRTGSMIGTPSYTSPEQVEGRAATPQADIYSLCVVLFEVATGSPPYDASEGYRAVALQHLASPVPDPCEREPTLPAAAGALIVRGLQKDPGDRFADADELVAALRETRDLPQLRRPRPVAPPTVIRPPDPEEAAGPGPSPDVPPRASSPAPVAAEPDREPEPAPPAAGTVHRPAAREGAVTPGTVVRPTRDEEAPPAREPGGRRGAAAWVAGALAVAAVAAIAGLLIGRGPEREPAPAAAQTIQTAGVETRLPAGWTPVSATIPGVSLARGASYAPVDGPAAGLVMVGRSRGTGPTLLPPSLLQRLREVPDDGEAVDLGGAQAVSFTGLPATGIGTDMTVFAVPTGDGVITVACQAAPDHTAQVAAACDTAATSLDLSDDRVYALDPSPAYARAVQGALTPLTRARVAGLARLREARLPEPQAAAASTVAAAHRRAVAALRRVDAGPGPGPAHRSLIASVSRGGTAFARMASAAAREDRAAYDAARRDAAAADRDLRASLERLAQLGYAPG